MHRPQAGDERRGAGVEEGLGESAHSGEQLAGLTDLAGVEYDDRADAVLPGRLAFSLTVVAPKYCGSTVPPRLRPCSSSLASRILPELAAPCPEKCSRSNPPERSKVRTPVGVAVTGLGPEPVLEVLPLVDGFGERELRIAVLRAQRLRVALAHPDLPRREAVQVPADEAVLRQELGLCGPRAVRRLQVDELPRHERLVGVHDEVLQLRAVLPQVGLHLHREELVEELGADVLELLLTLLGFAVGVLPDRGDVVEDRADRALAVLDPGGLEADGRFAREQPQDVLEDHGAVALLALDDVEARQSFELGGVDPLCTSVFTVSSAAWCRRRPCCPRWRSA